MGNHEKSRTDPNDVNVVVHYVTGARKNASGEYEKLKPPSCKPTAASIKQKLYDVYSRQINCWFDTLTCVEHTVEWDIGTDSAWGTAEHPINSSHLETFNNDLDLGGNMDGESLSTPLNTRISVEEQKLLDLKAGQTNVDIDVFVVGGCWSVTAHEGRGGILYVDKGIYAGLTRRPRAACYIAGSQVTGDQSIPEDEMLQTIAHEIGHVIIGPGHPDLDVGSGPAPLKGTNHLERLMHSDVVVKKKAGCLDRNLIVKKEWDAADEWLFQKIDQKEPQ